MKKIESSKEKEGVKENIFLVNNEVKEKIRISQKIFFGGQIYDAFSLLTELIAKAKKEIVLIDNYVDIHQ